MRRRVDVAGYDPFSFEHEPGEPVARICDPASYLDGAGRHVFERDRRIRDDRIVDFSDSRRIIQTATPDSFCHGIATFDQLAGRNYMSAFFASVISGFSARIRRALGALLRAITSASPHA